MKKKLKMMKIEVLRKSTFFIIFGLAFYGLKMVAFAEQTSGFKPVSGPNWVFKVLSVENTKLQKWKEQKFSPMQDSHIVAKDKSLSFWRMKCEVRRKKVDLEMQSDWIQLIYETDKNRTIRRSPAAYFLFGEGASTGGLSVSSKKPDLSIPFKLDLLFIAPKNTEEVKYMAVQFLDYPKVQVIPK